MYKWANLTRKAASKYQKEDNNSSKIVK